MKKIILIIVVLVILIGAVFGYFYFNRESFIQKTIESGITEITGLSTKVSGVQIGDDSKVKIQKMIIANPENFFSENLAILSGIELDCDIKGLMFNKAISCKHIRATIDAVYMNRTKDGRVNFREIKALQKENVEKVFDGGTAGFMIDRLELYYGRVDVIEQSSVGTKNSTVNLKNAREIYGFIADPRAFVYLPSMKIVFGLNRGSLGLPRSIIQKRIMEVTGKK